MSCPFCKCDPFEYVDNGVCMEPVAVTCCGLGIDLYLRNKHIRQYAYRILRYMRSHSPRRKAKAWRAMVDNGVREPGRRSKAGAP